MDINKILVAKYISEYEEHDLCITTFTLKVKLISDSDTYRENYEWNKVERKVKNKDQYIDYEQCLAEYKEQFEKYDPENDEDFMDHLCDIYGYDVMLADLYIVKEV